MSTPILATKLFVPPSRSNVVLRPWLIERLDEGLRGGLILVSAPAGFGKTTTISECRGDWQTFKAGQSFEVAPDSSFRMKLDGVADYCCSYG
ncbi:MAG: hypothetical protein A2133_06285 [Actinobacteria bacterium RBG_16_64_13]|nr:MAG: hypothetical protein A2133_06285 [Actinobacteria bacterium RBG_16_64_13]